MMSGLENLKELRDGLDSLNPNQFSYRYQVEVFDSNHNCGSVCCALGWIPRFLPHLGYKWVRYGVSVYVSKGEESDVISRKEASEIFGVDIDSIMFMFFGGTKRNIEIVKELGKKRRNEMNERFGICYNSDLRQVINRIDYIIENYENYKTKSN